MTEQRKTFTLVGAGSSDSQEKLKNQPCRLCKMHGEDLRKINLPLFHCGLLGCYLYLQLVPHL